MVRMKEDVQSVLVLQVEQILRTFSAKGIKDLLIRDTMTMSKTAKDAWRNMKLVYNPGVLGTKANDRRRQFFLRAFIIDSLKMSRPNFLKFESLIYIL